MARARSEIRNLAVALETYYIDYNSYPPAVTLAGEFVGGTGQTTSVGAATWGMTSPIAHLSSIPNDPFGPKKTVAGEEWDKTYQYGTEHLGCWILTSRGPDLDPDDMNESEYVDPTGAVHCEITEFLEQFVGTQVEYDPTNGTISNGDLYRTGP